MHGHVSEAAIVASKLHVNLVSGTNKLISAFILKREKMDDTNAESPTSLPACQGSTGIIAQPSVRDVVLRSTGIDLQSFESNDPEKLLVVLMFLFKGLLENTYNGDAVFLAKYRAADLLHGLIEDSEVYEIADMIIIGMNRRPDPAMDSMF